MKILDRELNILLSPKANDKLIEVSKFERVGIPEVIRRSIYVNKVLVEKRAKTVKVGNRYEHKIENGLLQPFDKEFGVFVYQGLFPNLAKLTEVMRQSGPFNVKNLDLYPLEFSAKILSVMRVTDGDWQKAIEKSLWNYLEVKMNQKRSINTNVKVTSEDNSEFILEYPHNSAKVKR